MSANLRMGMVCVEDTGIRIKRGGGKGAKEKGSPEERKAKARNRKAREWDERHGYADRIGKARIV